MLFFSTRFCFGENHIHILCIITATAVSRIQLKLRLISYSSLALLKKSKPAKCDTKFEYCFSSIDPNTQFQKMLETTEELAVMNI